jgi:peptide/nickel transport system permease protein
MRSYIAIHFIFAMTEAMYAQVFIVILGLVPVSGRTGASCCTSRRARERLYFRDSIWYILSPILAISLVQLSLVSFASALEDIFNPRLRGSA